MIFKPGNLLYMLANISGRLIFYNLQTLLCLLSYFQVNQTGYLNALQYSVHKSATLLHIRFFLSLMLLLHNIPINPFHCKCLHPLIHKSMCPSCLQVSQFYRSKTNRATSTFPSLSADTILNPHFSV